MELELSLVMDRVHSPNDFTAYLEKIHAFLMQTSKLGENFSHYYLQAGDPEEMEEMDIEAHIESATQYKVPSNFTDFLSMLASVDEAPDNEEFYILGLWNGNTDFLTASSGSKIDSFSLSIRMTSADLGGISRSHKASVEFCFMAGDIEEYNEKKRIAESIIALGTSILPFKYATFFDRAYISSYTDMPQIVIGGSLYGRSAELDTIKGFRRQLSGDIEEISPVQGSFDAHSPEHIQKAHRFEEELLQNHQFRQLLLR